MGFITKSAKPAPVTLTTIKAIEAAVRERDAAKWKAVSEAARTLDTRGVTLDQFNALGVPASELAFVRAIHKKRARLEAAAEDEAKLRTDVANVRTEERALIEQAEAKLIYLDGSMSRGQKGTEAELFQRKHTAIRVKLSAALDAHARVAGFLNEARHLAQCIDAYECKGLAGFERHGLKRQSLSPSDWVE